MKAPVEAAYKRGGATNAVKDAAHCAVAAATCASPACLGLCQPLNDCRLMTAHLRSSISRMRYPHGRLQFPSKLPLTAGVHTLTLNPICSWISNSSIILTVLSSTPKQYTRSRAPRYGHRHGRRSFGARRASVLDPTSRTLTPCTEGRWRQ